MEVTDNTEMRHFETQTESGLAFIEYQIQEKKYFLTKAEFPEGFEDSGKADEMMKEVLEMLRETGMRVVPMNKFVKKYFKANREYRDMMPVGIHL